MKMLSKQIKSALPEECADTLNSVINESRDGIVFASTETGQIITANPAFKKMTGRNASSLKNLKIWQILPTEREMLARTKFAEAVNDGKGSAKYLDIIRPDGKLVPIQFWYKKISYLGKPVMMLVIHSLKEINELKKLNHLYNIFFKQSDDAMAIVEFKDGHPFKYLDMNKAAVKLYGYTKNEWDKMIAKSPSALMHLRKHLSRELIYHTKDGHKIFAYAKLRKIKYGDQEIALGVQRDITRYKLLEQKLSEQYKKEFELRQELELQLKQHLDFTMALVHELKSPLTAVISSSEQLKEDVGKVMTKKLSVNIQRGATNLRKRVEELLDVAKSETGALKINSRTTNIGTLIAEVVGLYSGEAERLNQKIGFRKPEVPLFAHADAGRIKQVISNLLDNALKFNRPGGTISVSVKPMPGQILIEVKDQGMGIDSAYKKKIFDPYFCTDPHTGFGIGLALSKTLVELHQGTISVKSTRGKGAKFSVILPACEKVNKPCPH